MNVGHVHWSRVLAVMGPCVHPCRSHGPVRRVVPADPPAPRQESPAAAAPITIPAEVTKDGLVFLRALVNDSRPMWFALDSAASFPIVIDTGQARVPPVEPRGRRSWPEEVPGRTPIPSLGRGVPKVDLGGFEAGRSTKPPRSPSVRSRASSAGRWTGWSERGDCSPVMSSRSTIVRAEGDPAPTRRPTAMSGGGERVPLALRGNFFFIPAAIEMPGRTQLEGAVRVVDTGAGLTMILTTAFARSKNLPAPVQKILVDRSDAGLGGETSMTAQPRRVHVFRKPRDPEPIVYVSQDAAGALATSEYDGVIGGGILRRFKVIFDYARQQLILEPNAGSDEPIEYDMSGTRLHTEGDQFGTFRIHQVLEHTPAARAGLRRATSSSRSTARRRRRILAGRDR